ncbi:MAG TPA: hypothetical protein ENK28_04595 [Aliiroseovarius sp.]|nr:hypothetical protein [Aliiroseovarius sp.]
MPAAPATKAAIKRAIEATTAAGLQVCAVSVSRDGTVRVETVRIEATERIVDNATQSVESAHPKRWALG